MRFQFLFLSIILTAGLVVSSCSSDPCDDIICVNGSCNEGICDCAEGWKGPSCDEVDYNFIGEYRSTSIGSVTCPDGSADRFFATNSDNEVCVTEGEWTSCLSVLLRLEEDNSYFLNIISSRSNGVIRTGDPTVIRGDYTLSGNTALLCDASTCIQMTLDMTQKVITWDQSQGTATNCGIRWELTRQ